MSELPVVAQSDFARNSLQKEQALTSILQSAGRLLVAYSGGVDSAYLAFRAYRVLGVDALAVTALSPSYPQVQREMAERVARECGFAQLIVNTFEMQNEAYLRNAPDRCYYCKSELFRVMEQICVERNFSAIAYGLNADDTRDFRPGHRAARERAVLSPLLEANLSKAEIRWLSQRAGLATANWPASPCLASRLPYGVSVTKMRLEQVEEGERRLRNLGFHEFRLRHHGELARVEVAMDELARALDPQVTQTIIAEIMSLGFCEVVVDPRGYRSGSLNENLSVTEMNNFLTDGQGDSR